MKTISEFFEGKKFDSREDFFRAIKQNKQAIVKAKASTDKKWVSVPFNGGGTTLSTKAEPDNGMYQPKIVVNCCNIMDSHEDVHIPGNYTKSVNEQGGGFPFLQEHVLSFRNMIDDDVKGTVEMIPWSELGAPYEGTTEAFVMYPKISKERSPYMFGEYMKGHVKQHSIGMRYVWSKLFLGLNIEEEEFQEEKQVWDKYRPQIVNGEKADELGFFWAVTEIKIVEGSAVPRGSNPFTPTLEAGKATSTNNEPSIDTQTTELLTEIKNTLKCLNSKKS